MRRTHEEVVETERYSAPAMSAEARENQLIALAVDEAERQLREHKASSQVICHYLKLASSKEKLEKQLLEKQVELARAKTEAIQSAQRTEELFKEAIAAFQNYRIEESSDDEY